MRKCLVLSGLLGLAMISSGCVVAMGNKGTLRADQAKEVVAIDGRLYIVDTRTGEVVRLKSTAIQEAEDFDSTKVKEVRVEVKED